jgi:hypothetical protein
MIGQWITTAGLACDIIGAWLVAIEVVRVFQGPTTIDIGHSGTLNGGFIPAPNPDYEKHERQKRYIMSGGLFFLTVGFLLQGLGTWWPSLTAS